MKRHSTTLWGIGVDSEYRPSISILVPAYNEEKIVRLKLENLSKVIYPREKMEVIFIDDCSTDNTVKEAQLFLNSCPTLNSRVFSLEKRCGKAKALNSILRHAQNEVVIVSDADCFWTQDILMKSLPYLSDPSVGAVTGLELLLNPDDSWVTKTETFYNDSVHTIRVGESKFQSTIFFQGGFSAYKTKVLDEFNNVNDDTGTALDIVQKGFRTLLIPDATYFTIFPSTWKGKFVTKIRRAFQLVMIWVKCLRLLSKGQLVLDRKIALPEIFLYIFNPLIFILLTFITPFLFLSYPFQFSFLIIILTISISIKKIRTMAVECLQDNIFLLIALLSFVLNKKVTIWKTVRDPRSPLTRIELENKRLI
jgi:cellulose synthase/poly-beta-1,6-N-acetylglucosamine synthase-like glycosyltransferase